MVLAYSMTGRMTVSYVVSKVSFCFPQVVEVRALSILNEASAFSFVILVLSAKVRLGSKVSPKILGFLTVGILILFMDRLRMTLCSCGSGVKSVDVDLSGFSMRSFLVVQSYISFRYGWRHFQLFPI